jgi:integrase
MAGLYNRNGVFYAKFTAAGRINRVSLKTTDRRIARAKLNEIESALARGKDSPLPTRTPLEQALAAYVEHMQATKIGRSAYRDTRILRQVFGPACPALDIDGNRKPDQDGPTPSRQNKQPTILARHVEEITPAQVSEFISSSVRARGLSPRSANRFREVLSRLFSWSMKFGNITMPADRNPAAQVEKYREKAPQIRYLTLRQIHEQLDALAESPQLQTMVAMYIYAGLRREEALWLTLEDVDLSAGTHGMIRIQAKTFGGEFWQPKTATNRAVPISSTLRGWLDAYAPRPSIGGWYFPSPQGYRYDVDNFSRDHRKANKAAGLPWTCLDYRHTFGSHLAQKGLSLYQISSFMGNSPEICRRHYAALQAQTPTMSLDFVPEPDLISLAPSPEAFRRSTIA